MEWLYQFCMDNLGYDIIFIFMAIESSFIPFPSEVVVPPAGYLVAAGKLSMPLVVLSASMGSLFGAIINYAIAYFLGRPFLYKLANSKFGKVCRLSVDNIDRAELYFKRNGALSTFVGRLIPGIRQLISLPAGLSKMNFVKFMVYTFLGAGIWNIILALIGYFLHEIVNNINDIPDKASQYGKMISLVIICILAICLIIYYLRKKHKDREKQEEIIAEEEMKNQEE